MPFFVNTSIVVRRLASSHVKTGFLPNLYFLRSVSFCAETTMANSTSNSILRRVDNILKSEGDKREYRGLELANHMKVMLVSDPTTDKSSAAMDVNVGFLDDPKDTKGIAHFCEHMLFLGTKKYPNENDYNKFLSDHGGSGNAATHVDHTTYYFSIAPDQLAGALDRFSQFFVSPLFTESATDREINAVHSEHEKNISCDAWRLDQLDKHLSDPNHPFNTFGTGNKYTLETLPKERNIDIRSVLIDFHKKWYSANIMSLAVLGKESLDELEELVVPLFSSVKDNGVVASCWEEHPFHDEHFRTKVFVKPIKDLRNLNIVFPSIDDTIYYKSAPIAYISHLIGHEGPGSLLSVLKARGWSNSLIAGGRQAPRGFGFFGIVVDLTIEGVDHIDDIVKLVFQYINMIKREGPLQWIHEESAGLRKMVFRFKDKESPESYISSLVCRLQSYPLEDVLSAYSLVDKWTPEVIERVWDTFTPDKIRIAINAQQFESELDEEEPWYGTKYCCVKIPEEIINDWKNAGFCPDLRIPDKNEFVPTNFDLYPLDSDISPHPVIIQDNALSRVWFKQDDKFLLPKAVIMMDCVSPLAYFDPVTCNLTHIFIQLFRDSLNEYAYAAELAGLKWHLVSTRYGLFLAISGYNHKQHILLDKIVDKLTSFKVDPERFKIIKENYTRSLKNFFAEQPYQHAVYYLSNLLSETAWSTHELLQAMQHVNLKELENFIPVMLSKMHIECFVHGNVNKEKALQLVKIAEDYFLERLEMTPLLPRQLLLNRELKLENGCHYLYQVENNVHKSSCIELYFQCGLQSTETNTKLDLLAHILHEPCYSILRTKEQLGYIVFSGIRDSNGVQGLRIIVQSDRHPSYLECRIEEFLKTIYTEIVEMSEEAFATHREAVAVRRLEKPKQLAAQTYIYWAEINGQQYHFDRTKVEVDYLRTLQKDDIVEFFEKLISADSPERKKLSLYVVSMADGGAGHETDEKSKLDLQLPNSATKIEDVTEFKSSHETHAHVTPYMPISRKGNRSKL